MLQKSCEKLTKSQGKLHSACNTTVGLWVGYPARVLLRYMWCTSSTGYDAAHGALEVSHAGVLPARPQSAALVEALENYGRRQK